MMLTKLDLILKSAENEKNVFQEASSCYSDLVCFDPAYGMAIDCSPQ